LGDAIMQMGQKGWGRQGGREEVYDSRKPSVRKKKENVTFPGGWEKAVSLNVETRQDGSAAAGVRDA